jgi:hypothetical protein
VSRPCTALRTSIGALSEMASVALHRLPQEAAQLGLADFERFRRGRR